MRQSSQTLKSMICPAHQSCLCDRHGRTKIATNKLCRLATVLPYTAAHEVSAARAQNHAEAIPWSVNTQSHCIIYADGHTLRYKLKYTQ
jgi:hypothetical protein